MTPAERNAVLEEAAQIADLQAALNGPWPGTRLACEDIAAAIRALKEQEPTT